MEIRARENRIMVSSTKDRVIHDLKTNKIIYLMVLPVLVYFIIFKYGPMYGIMIAFKEYSAAKGILHSSWVGLEHFQEFFGSLYFGRTLRNTVLVSLYSIIWEFPAPII